MEEEQEQSYAQQIEEILKADTDYIVRGTAADGMVRAFAATTRRTVQTARDDHETSPVVTAALGRLLTAGAIMGSMLKDPEEVISLLVRGDGPIGALTVTADSQGHVKGFAANPQVWLPLNNIGKLDVGQAVGNGTLTVIQDAPWAEPYSSEINLVSGEIGDDIAAYYVQSEQVATSVGVGVLVDKDLSVRQAGGFVIQLMPDCKEDVIEKLEANLASIKSVTDMFEQGMSPADILAQALDGLGFEPLEASPVSFYCNCSHERTERVLITLGEDELTNLIKDDKPVELVCNFCGSKYTFTVDELRSLLEQVKAQKPKE